MDNEERKIGKIIEELTVYFLNVGGRNISSEINSDGKNVTVTFNSDYSPEYEDEVKKVGEFFDEPRNEGMEDLYWELAGSGDAGTSSQLQLIAHMAGDHEFSAGDGHVRIVLHKKLWE